MNLARAVGPAIAGVLIGQLGVAAVFALNALTYVALAVVLMTVRPPVAKEQLLPERFGGALLAGTRYVRHSPVIRALLLRTLLFVVPGAALWALLPLVASTLLGLDATGYGVLLGALGIGAVVGATVLPRVLARLSLTQLVASASLVFGVATATCALAPNLVVAVVALVPAGLAWLCMLATMNGNLQMFLPGWVRARGLSIYQMVFAGGQALASLAWGVIAEWLGLVPVLLAAGVLLALGAISVVARPLRDATNLDRSPAGWWPDPILVFDPELEEGPVLVTVAFVVPPENVGKFLDAMVPVRRMKMRTGATSFAVYRDGADPHRFIEVAQYPSWAEHLRQHGGRLTASDRELEVSAQVFATGTPRVEHLLPPAAVLQDPLPPDR
jgi:MFS family permease